MEAETGVAGVATNQGMLKIANNHKKLERGKEESSPKDFRDSVAQPTP